MTKEIPYPPARFSCHQAGTSKDEGIGESAGLTLALFVAHRRQPGTGGSDLPHDRRVLLAQQPIPGLIAHMVFGPRVHVIHVHFIPWQRRHCENTNSRGPSGFTTFLSRSRRSSQPPPTQTISGLIALSLGVLEWTGVRDRDVLELKRNLAVGRMDSDQEANRLECRPDPLDFLGRHPRQPSATKQMRRRLISRVQVRKKEAPEKAERGYSQSQCN
jgi:hypothetical protein